MDNAIAPTRVETQLKTTLYFATAMIAVGVFLPLAQVPVYGEVSYYRVTETGSCLVVGFAFLGASMLLVNWPSWVWLAAIGIWTTLLFPVIEDAVVPDRRTLPEAALDAALNTVTSPLRDLVTDMIIHLTDLSWGSLVLLPGCVLFSVASVLLIRRK